MSLSRRYVDCLALPMPWFVWVALSLGLAVSGPFGSYGRLALPERLLFWSSLVAVALALGLGLWLWLAGLGLDKPLRKPAVAAGLTLPVWALLRFGLGAEAAPTGPEVGLALFCATLWLAAGPALPAPPLAPGRPRLLHRLPLAARGDLVSISVRGHYVDVATSAGTASLLLRFSDAVEETAGVAGGQVHRSHWIAWDAVAGVERGPGRLFLVLKTGARVPVSRTYRDRLEKRGLI